MSKKQKVAILFGGRSAEHQVSLLSAKNVIAALDRERFSPILIAIGQDGSWFLSDQQNYLHNPDDPARISLVPSERSGLLCSQQGKCYFYEFSGERTEVDIVFPVLHGTYGEDGTVQGLLQLLNVPFVGPDLLGSAVAMDKDVSKRLLHEAGIPVCPGRALFKSEFVHANLEEIYQELGPAVFVKPANLGSSVGVKRAMSFQEFHSALEHAFCFDLKVIVEQAFPGREIECAVLGNENATGSVFGEIVPSKKHGFYSYEAKYIDPDGAALIAPAQLDQSLSEKLREVAVKAFRTLCCEGMSRVDFLVKDDGSFVVNEINTIPGFTKISMYPRLWAESGVEYSELISRLIDLGLERFQKRAELSTLLS